MVISRTPCEYELWCIAYTYKSHLGLLSALYPFHLGLHSAHPFAFGFAFIDLVFRAPPFAYGFAFKDLVFKANSLAVAVLLVALLYA